jgi:hypothetical protein
MKNHSYDIIIIGGGIAGLYTGYNILQKYPNKSFIILEKNKKKFLGGRMGNHTFYGEKVVIGAGVGRKKKDKLLVQLINELCIKYHEFKVMINYADSVKRINVKDVIEKLKKIYESKISISKPKPQTFKEFAEPILGKEDYKNFLISSGYTDYENEDIRDTLYNYGMDDNIPGWAGLSIPWDELINTLCKKIGTENIKTNKNVISIKKPNNIYQVKTDKGIIYSAQTVIIATPINVLKKLLPMTTPPPIYNEIHGQPFLRVYGKFSKSSCEILKSLIPVQTVVNGPLHKIIPINSEKGIYMIAYSDNKDALFLEKHTANIKKNRLFFTKLLEKAFDLQQNTLKLISMIHFFWPIGTHYYDPLSNAYTSRDEFIKDAQNPMKNLYVVGEMISNNQGWTEGALESVKEIFHSDI